MNDSRMLDDEVPEREITDVVLPAFGISPSRTSTPYWQTQLLARPNVPGLPTVGIWRVRGAAWSTILKLLRLPAESSAWAGDPDPAHPFYWRREAEAFANLGKRLPADTGSGIRMPRCYGVVDRTDGAVAIWMEDVHGEPGTGWDLERYGRLAYQLAGWHHAPAVRGLVGQADAGELGKHGWLGRDWLRTYVGRRDPVGHILADPEVWRHPAVRRLLDPNRAEAYRQLWERRHQFLAEVDAQPRVLCHLDMHPRNLFDVDGETVLIDWAFCGLGGLGEDLGTLVVDAITDFHLEPERISPLFETLVSNYAAGSPTYDEHTVRRAVADAALARYAWLIPALLTALVEGRERINGRPSPEAAPAWAAVCRFLLESAERG